MKLQYVQAGEIVTTHGLTGEVKVLPWGDGPEFLCGFSRVRLDGREWAVERCRIQKSCNLLKLRGIDTVEQAQALRGKIVEIYRCDAPADVLFGAELMGMAVYADGKEIGTLTDVLDYPGNKVYVVQGAHEYLIPAVKEFILSTDVEKNIMQVHLLEGMASDAD